MPPQNTPIHDNEWDLADVAMPTAPPSQEEEGTFTDDVEDETTTDIHTSVGEQKDVRHEAMKLVAKFNSKQLPALVRSITDAEINRKDAERQRLEDERANRRNRNRSLTLVVALLFTFAVPWFIASVLNNPGLLKFATGIAIFPDAIITLYAWVKHY